MWLGRRKVKVEKEGGERIRRRTGKLIGKTYGA